MAKVTAADKQDAMDRLKAYNMQPGETVYTIVKHRSRSGMYRVIDLYIMRDNVPLRISWSVGTLVEGYDRNHEGAKASGCGMDMGFHLVYSLSRELFPSGFGTMGQASLYPQGVRPASKEHAAHLRSKGVQFIGRNGDTSGWDNDGGYALKQSWM
ncbi:hypothetical protein LCGC14_1430240 [marine sediment metagenome]|uniref:Uncharacterized protein n=1 Tax=marine sediment metagenome TaxID=412755 RepID=A0A0F9K9Z3_9ZZZZ